LKPLPGGHHYNGNYDKHGAAIAAALPQREEVDVGDRLGY
jgi:type IV secretory pathway VirJ component